MPNRRKKDIKITRSLKGWGYGNKAHLHGLNSVHLYKEMVLILFNNRNRIKYNLILCMRYSN